MESTQIIEAAAFATAAIAGARRLLPKLDGWWVVLALLAICGVSGYGALGATREAVVFAAAVFVTSYGGYNAVRKLLETAAVAIGAAWAGSTIPPPPKLPSESEAPKGGAS